MKLVVGLGNPGVKYRFNRHNIGFLILEYSAERKNKKFIEKDNYLYFCDNDTLFIKPLTYMNLSGEALTEVFEKYDISDFLVLSDDIYLPLGEIRIRSKGGDGGHNGLKSVAEHLGTVNYNRLRIGVGKPDSGLKDYVLGDFSEDDFEILNETMPFVDSLLDVFSKHKFEEVLNNYSKNKKSYSDRIKISESKDQRSENDKRL
ncbi:MAG: aminoacyl-tRNA hydrolase [Candidatus Cloacimonadota bacterium]|nr:MAG: aminoacyl-tRNA hydrolase [Candidatus Cloacimonadota bacterium]